MIQIIIMAVVLIIYGNIPSGTAIRCNYREDKPFYLRANCSKRNLTSIPVVYSNVVVLDLSHNCIKVIKNNSFLKLSVLQILNLECNKLEWLEQGAFLGLNKLTQLIIDVNRLAYTDQHFSKYIFKPLKSLKHLDICDQDGNLENMDKMNLAWFSDNVISDLINLQSIIIDLFSSPNNSLFGEGFSSLTKLTNVKVGGICDIYGNKELFSNIPNLVSIDLSYCIIKSYAVGTLNGRNLKYLNLQRTMFTSAVWYNLQQDFVNNSIETLVLTYTFHDFEIGDFLGLLFKLNGTGIKKLFLNHIGNHGIFSSCNTYSPYILPSTLQLLDLSYSDLTGFCFSMTNLSSLNLEQNNLGNFYRSNTYYKLYDYPPNLTDINLSYNNIDNLYGLFFHGEQSLRIINLSNNFITDINFDISTLTSLKVLDLSKNKIQKFSKTSMDMLDFLFDISDVRINISGNILLCNCETIQFLEWMIDQKQHFHETNGRKCKFENGTEHFITEFSSTMQKLKKDCASHIALIICISIAITSMLIILTIGIAYRYRWRLRYIYYMTQSKYNTKTNLIKKDDRNFMYDAFISYSDDENDFIINKCIPFLEERDNVKLCIHKRDFLPGREILHNITNSIHESRNVICILTKSFLESYYCMFEFNMARMESIYARNGKNMLFLVFYEQLRPKDLPLVMLELVEKDSYIEYPNDEQGNIIFWEKLKEAMT